MLWPIYQRRFNIWDPWREMRLLQQEFDKLLQRGDRSEQPLPAEFPAVNLYGNDEQAVLTAEIPGVDPAELDISVHNDQLTVKGSRTVRECGEGEVYHRQERGFGSFVRTVGLPFEIDTDKVSAEYKNGILTITLPRAEHDRPRQITVKAS